MTLRRIGMNPLRSAARSVARFAQAAAKRRHDRRGYYTMLTLSDRDLKDIGWTRADVLNALSRPGSLDDQ